MRWFRGFSREASVLGKCGGLPADYYLLYLRALARIWERSVAK